MYNEKQPISLFVPHILFRLFSFSSF